jgi:hypothetical protein
MRGLRTTALVAIAAVAGLVGGRAGGRDAAPRDQAVVDRLERRVAELQVRVRAQPLAARLDEPPPRAAEPAETAPAETRTESPRRHDVLDAAIAATPADPVWSSTVEERVRAALADPAAGDSRLADVRCGGDTCRIRLEHDDEQVSAELRPILGELFPASAIYGRRVESAPGSYVTSVYVSAPRVVAAAGR